MMLISDISASMMLRSDISESMMLRSDISGSMQLVESFRYTTLKPYQYISMQ
jgi:hypothetical protein